MFVNGYTGGKFIMTVKELIEKLQQFEKGKDVYLVTCFDPICTIDTVYADKDGDVIIKEKWQEE